MRNAVIAISPRIVGNPSLTRIREELPVNRQESPIDIQVIGNNLEGNRAWVSQLLEKVRYVPGT